MQNLTLYPILFEDEGRENVGVRDRMPVWVGDEAFAIFRVLQS